MTMNIEEEFSKLTKFSYDILIIGAGGAGLRAAIAGAQNGANVGVVTKSLLGKAHTVMAEGGAAAALGNSDSRDNWKVHFRDTIRGGKFHCNWRMAQIHAQQSPDRINEMEEWGAVFDRTPDGKINQRNFGGHQYPRLAHVGDRTGLELIRTLQDKVIHEENVHIHMEFVVTKLFKVGDKIAGALVYQRDTGELVLFQAKSIIMATGGIGKSYEITSNSWEYTGDGHSLAFQIGAELIDMEFIQFHPTGMVYPSSVRGILVTEGVRGEGGVLRNSEGERFMFNYVPEMFAGEYATSEEEAQRWLDGDDDARRPPELLTRDVVARSILSEVKAGRGSKHNGAYLDIASQRPAEYIKKKLPSMYHQFKTLANLDITAEPMEVGPTTHYIMGGIRVDPETQSTNINGLYAAGEVSAGLHGANRLGGNSLTDLLVFGKISGDHAAKYAKDLGDILTIPTDEIKTAISHCLGPFDPDRTENPYALHKELKTIMGEFVGIIRTEENLIKGIKTLEAMLDKAKKSGAKSGRTYNPGWHQALDIENMVITGLLLANGALFRKESRGGHTRVDYPDSEKSVERTIYIQKIGVDASIDVTEEELNPVPDDLQKIIEEEY